MLRIGWICAAGMMVAALAGAALAGEKEFALREHLGVSWRDELVTFAFDFPEGACHRDSLRLRGPSGPLPVQVVTSQDWPGEAGHLKSATIGFFADLDPLAAARYVLSWEADPAAAPAAPPSGLTVGRSGDLVAVASHAFGAVFQTGGEEFAVPAEAAAVPGPVRQMLLPDGRRFGGSALSGPTKLVAWSGEMVAAGPVFADLRWRYRYEDGSEFLLRGRLGARDTAIYWDMSCRGTITNDGWRLLISDGLPPLSLSVQIEHFSQRTIAGRTLVNGDLVSFPVANEPAGKLTSVTPWADWTSDYTQTVVILNDPAGSPAFFAASRDPGVWMEPETTPGKPVWGRLEKSLPLVKQRDGGVALVAPVIDGPGGGLRRWMTGVPPRGMWEQVVEISKNEFTGVVQQQLQMMVDKRRLDWVKEFVLDWPEDRRPSRPMLIVNQDDIRRCRSRKNLPPELAGRLEQVRGVDVAPTPEGNDGIALAAWLLGGSPRVAGEVKLVERLRRRLGLLGNFDLMRSAPLVATLYDGVIDSGLVGDAERRLMRARMAYLGYRMEDPATWSPERGYNTGLPNMNVSFALGRGIFACALPDHPRAATWATPALARMDSWLDEQVGTRGEWMEGASYDHVTASSMIAFAIAAKNAGFRDYSRHEKFQLLLEYIAKQYTPPDPTRGGLRVTPPLGRANAGLRMGLFGVMSRFMRDTDADYAAGMQWMWRQSGERYGLANNWLCGLEHLYIDPGLPSRQPRWRTELFPLSTAVFRSRFGRADEDYGLVFLNPEIHFARPSEVGALLDWFAFGQPVAGAFTGGYDERHELLTTRVVPARAPTPQEWGAVTFHKTNGGLTAFSTQPRLDYLRCDFTIDEPMDDKRPMPAGMPAFPAVERAGKPPIPWRRQLMFVKGVEPQEPAYFVFRDVVEGDQPTLWQFWALSNGIAPSGRRSAAAPRDVVRQALPAAPLPGTRFTAVGQHGVDLDFFVVAPDEPRAQTLRWGTSYKDPPDIGYTEHRDLLQLRRDGAGAYVVVVLPRRRGDQPATVVAEAGGRAIRVRHAFGSDLVVLADGGPTEVGEDSFDTPAAVVQDRRGGRTVTLGAAGTATVAGRSITAEAASTTEIAAP